MTGERRFPVLQKRWVTAAQVDNHTHSDPAGGGVRLVEVGRVPRGRAVFRILRNGCACETAKPCG